MEETHDVRAERCRRETRVRKRGDQLGLVVTKARRRLTPGSWLVIDPNSRTLTLGPTDLDDLERFLAESSS